MAMVNLVLGVNRVYDQGCLGEDTADRVWQAESLCYSHGKSQTQVYLTYILIFLFYDYHPYCLTIVEVLIKHI